MLNLCLRGDDLIRSQRRPHSGRPIFDGKPSLRSHLPTLTNCPVRTWRCPVIPPALARGSVKTSDPPVSLQVAVGTAPTGVSEFWSALGAKLRASLTVQATTSVAVGRAFASASRSQTQILAGSSDTTVSASATADWAKKGAIPAVSAVKDCAKNGVDVTASNAGDEAFTFELAGKSHSVAPGGSDPRTADLTHGSGRALWGWRPC